MLTLISHNDPVTALSLVGGPKDGEIVAITKSFRDSRYPTVACLEMKPQPYLRAETAEELEKTLNVKTMEYITHFAVCTYRFGYDRAYDPYTIEQHVAKRLQVPGFQLMEVQVR